MFSSWMMLSPEKLSSVVHLYGPDICLDLSMPVKLAGDTLRCVQSIPASKKLSVFISGESGKWISKSQFVNDLISVFFQPAFYQVQRRPVVFTKDPHYCKQTLQNLADHLKRQGFEGLEVITVSAGLHEGRIPDLFYYESIDCRLLLNKWTEVAMKSERLRPMHILFTSRATDQSLN